MSDCLFCKIAVGKIPSTKVYEDDRCYAFWDINPQAPVHVVLIPKAHIDGLNGLFSLEDPDLSALLRAVPQIAAREGIAQSGYRLISNCGPDACQSVQHLHFHILGGRKMSEEMA